MQKKIIDELATDIYSMLRSDTMSRAMASMLYDKGWRRQSAESTADVAPREEVAGEIFSEILNIIREYSHSACIAKNNYGITQAEYIGIDILKLKKKYTEGEK